MARAKLVQGSEKPVKKSYTTSIATASEVVTIAKALAVPESAIVNLALRDWLMKYRKEQYEAQTSSGQVLHSNALVA
ncbi:hypothetical protein [Nostoc sp.]